MDEFVHAYEMESLQLSIMARRDITNQLRSLFPEGSGDALQGFLATTKALAARRSGADEATDEDHKPKTCRLRVAGNDKDNFHRRLRNIHVLALTNAVLSCRLTGIEALDWPFNRLGEETGEDDASSMNEDGKAEIVDESRYRLDVATCLGRLLQSTAVYSSTIREVDLRGNYLGGESCRLLCSALIEAGSECSLRRLVLRGNPLGLAGGHALAQLLQSPNCTIEELDLGDARLEIANLISISTALRGNTTLRSLNLDNPVIQTNEEEAIQHIGKMLQVNGTLEELSLCKHQLSDHGAQVLAERLLINDTLRTLSLRANRIGSDGAEALAALCLRHPALSALDLSANRLTDAGGRAFARALSPIDSNEAFCSLRVLVLCSTSMSDDGVAAVVASCIEQRRSNAPQALQALLVWGNTFGDTSAPLLTELAAMADDENPIDMDVVAWTPTGEQVVRVAHRELPVASIGARFASCKRNELMMHMRIARLVHVLSSKRAALSAPRNLAALSASSSVCSPCRAANARFSRFLRVKTRNFSSSDGSTSDDEPFDVRADRAWRALSGVHDVVLARHSREKLDELRKEAARSDLWDGDATHAGRIVQQLATLEARENMAKELQRTFLDTRELFVLAKEEKDESLMRDCGDTMTEVLVEAQQMRVQLMLLGTGDDEDDDAAENASSCFVEIQAGAGGADSCDWVAMLARMYARWGASRQFSVHTVDEAPGVDGVGLRSVMLRVDGDFAYGWTRTEAGVHRLVRVSPFDSARRRHTSFAQVRVYPMNVAGSGSGSSKRSEVEIPSKDLRIDSFRSSGAGGQHVNTTDSAVRITHLPTGIVVQCQSDRSQHRNKASAMDVLRAKLRQRELETRAAEKRQYAMGLGENAWGNQIRSYVMHPYTLVKDHRTSHSETNVERVLDGGIDGFMEEMLLAQTKRDESDSE